MNNEYFQKVFFPSQILPICH